MDKKLTKLVLLAMGLLCIAAIVYISLDVRSTQDDLYALEQQSNFRNVPTKINFIEEWEDILELTREKIEDEDTSSNGAQPPEDNNIPGGGGTVATGGTSEGGGNLITYYSHGVSGSPVLTDDGGKGWLALYDGPTCKSTDLQEFDVKSIYEKYLGSTSAAKQALQSFGGANTGPNNSAGDFTDYTSGGGTVNLEGKGVTGSLAGTIKVNGINRHMIAIGPSFMIEEKTWKNEKVSASAMRYGTCIDIKCTVNGDVYYIPCIIVDIKNHSAENGFIQTGYSITDGSYVAGATDSVMIEWYGVSRVRNYSGNVSAGLKYFEDIKVIIYNDNKL